MTSQILNKLLHLPTIRMKEAAVSADGAAYADAVRHLFGLEDERSAEARFVARCRRSSRPRSCASSSPGPRAGARRAEGGLSVLVRIGSRGSRLALTQAEQAAEALRRPGVEIAFVPITTAGDRDRTRPFGQIGERGVFVKEIEEALLGGPHRRRRALRQGHDVDATPTASPSARISSATIRATR